LKDEKMKIRIDQQATATDCRPETLAEIRCRLTFDNPEYLDRKKKVFSTWGIDHEIFCFSSIPGGLVFSRGFTGQACRIAKQNGERLHFDDQRRVLPEVDLQFTGTLKPFQLAAVADIKKKDFCTLQSPTGSGKTVMTMPVIADRKQPALIICHTRELADQWVSMIETFLGIPKSEIGFVGGGKMRFGDRVTIGLVQSMTKHVDGVFPYIGFLIVDECHRAPSRTFTDVVSKFDCKYMLGLSATPYRRDGLTRLIHFHIGDEAYKVDGQALVDDGHICKAVVVIVETEFKTGLDPSKDYSRMLSELCLDSERNKLVASHAHHEAVGGSGLSLVLSDRKSHCEALRAALSFYGIDAATLTGDTSTKDRKILNDKLRAGNIRVLLATGALIGEGFDLPEISSVVLATPVKFPGRLIQYVGRALRPAPGKNYARIIDFCDSGVGVLKAGAKARLRTFQAMHGLITQ
jgi:superfamily II DNA or RNA helicase